MEISWFGQSCFKIKGKSAGVVVDPFDPEILGLKLPKDLTADLVLSTHTHTDHNNTGAVLGNPVVITGPGEYEVKGVSVHGVGSFHDNSQGSERGINTVFNILIDGINVVHAGDLGHLLSEEQVSEIGACDILLLPVGGNYTIDGEGAAKVVAQLEPRIIIPMHYKSEGSKADISGAEGFLKAMGAENVTPVPKLVVTRDKLPEETQVIVLSKS